MIFVTNLFNLLMLILRWIIEFYLFLTALRLAMSLSASCRRSFYYGQIKLLTDSFPKLIGNYLAKLRKAPIQPWLCWVIVITAAFLLRQILLSMVLVKAS